MSGVSTLDLPKFLGASVEVPKQLRVDNELSEILWRMISTFGATHGSLWVPTSGDMLSLALSTFPDDFLEAFPGQLIPPDIDGAASRSRGCFETRMPAYYPTLTSAPKCAFVEQMKTLGAEATWCIPVSYQEQSLGVITLDGRQGLMVEVMPELHAPEWPAVRLRQAFWEEAHFLLHVSVGALAELDDYRQRYEAPDRVAKMIAGTLGFEACAFFLVDNVDGTISLVGSSGLRGRDSHGEAVYRRGSGIVGHISLGKDVMIEDYRTHLSHHGGGVVDEVNSSDIRQYLGVPIREHSGNVIGVLRLRNKRPWRSADGDPGLVPRSGNRAGLVHPLNHLDLARAQTTAQLLVPLVSQLRATMFREEVQMRVGHDLETPANIIANKASYYHDLLERRSLSADEVRGLRSDLKKILDLSEVMVLLSNLARTADPDAILLRPVRLRPFEDLVSPVCELLEFRAGEGDLAIDTHSSYFRSQDGKMPPHLFFDKELVWIALYNIINNAIKYGIVGSVIRVYGGVEDARVIINVRGDSLHVPQDIAERIFDRMYRAPEAKKSVGGRSGIGLGLFISRRIMRAHGGDVVLRKSRGIQNTFTLSLPTTLMHRTEAKTVFEGDDASNLRG